MFPCGSLSEGKSYWNFLQASTANEQHSLIWDDAVSMLRAALMPLPLFALLKHKRMIHPQWIGTIHGMFFPFIFLRFIQPRNDCLSIPWLSHRTLSVYSTPLPIPIRGYNLIPVHSRRIHCITEILESLQRTSTLTLGLSGLVWLSHSIIEEESYGVVYNG